MTDSNQDSRAEILSLTDISKSFSGVDVLKNIRFKLYAGEVHALLGGNGAGKSTLMKIISGNLSFDSGTLVINGQSHSRLTPTKAHRLGIYLVPQEPLLFPNLSVKENILFGMEKNSQHISDLKAIINEFNIDIDLDANCGALEVADQQLVEILRGLIRRSSILILDEPTASLTPKESQKLFVQMKRLSERGVGIVFISHKLGEVWEVADYVSVMRDGVISLAQTLSKIKKEDVIASITPDYKNSKLSDEQNLWLEMPDLKHKDSSQVVLQLEQVTGEGFKDISLNVHYGEIVGLGGVVGSGRTELAETIYGLRHAYEGAITFLGQDYTHRHARERLAAGIVYLPEDRQISGLHLDASILWNVCGLSYQSAGMWRDGAKEQGILERYRRALGIKFTDGQQPVRTLSGGNQQKVLIAKCLQARPKLFIIDEPTRGVDVSAREDIYNIIKVIAGQGVAILLISSDVEEIELLSDRVYVMNDGQVSNSLSGLEINKNNIMNMAY
ncbi:autoinducer 2 ABC transporter ATP-binding protein LsrA [Celerinatantimonas diazotrophica]|uniref:Autoinducer 2 import ATP-binding protein LsrA n=1 Tax=Celerinatantimonas diazotrophica TaxID=412034 RepID=A0A4R1J8L8_9GAMM|nr:autoinducer 2 ABC transporter ATP-binding protein LsrA [Celerinatantimonas diazotrophica]TCK46918.1 autoinducer 2 ABC transporter ATP-binding protein [Celerinatantimonas diazotrophica]CAG9295686.1 Autoinducer 2 import ATP-binding protein LsrA [Celerinatantimonas diazotrophica]